VPLGYRMRHLPAGARFRLGPCAASSTAARFPSGRLEPVATGTGPPRASGPP
jgi:hypothetical protein